MIAITVASAPAALPPVTAPAAAPQLEWAAILATITGAMQTAPGLPRAPPDGEDEPPGGMSLPLSPLMFPQAAAPPGLLPDARDGARLPVPGSPQGLAIPGSSGQLPAVPADPVLRLPEAPPPVLERSMAGPALPPSMPAAQATSPVVSPALQPVTATSAAAALLAVAAPVVEAGPTVRPGQRLAMEQRAAGPPPAMAAMPSAATSPAPVMPPSRPMPDGSLGQQLPDPVPGVEAPRPEPLPVPVSLASSTTATPAPTAAVDPQAEPASLPLSAPLGSEEWQQQVSERTNWLVDQGQGRAQLRLNPPQLGVVDVQVLVDGDRATVAFSAHSSAAREALELALPRLREMLGGQGFSGVDVSVSHHSLPGRSGERQPLPAGDDAAAARFSLGNSASPVRAPARGRFDAYA